MSLLLRLRSDRQPRSSYAPWDDFWFHGRGQSTGISGIAMSPEAALTVSGFWAGVTIKAQDFASCPCLLYEKLQPTGRRRAEDKPLFWLLRHQPNPYQTAFEYNEMASAHLDLRGNFYAQIVLDGRGAVQALIPRHPDRVTPELLPSGRKRFVWKPKNAAEQIFTSDEMHHVCGFSTDGVKGLSVIEYGARSLGITLAGDRFAGQFFNQGATPSFYVKHPQVLGEPGQENLRKSIAAYTAGVQNAHGILVLEEGMDAGTLGIKPIEAQLLEARVFGIEEIARWLNMPLQKLAVNKAGAVSYASVEHFDTQYAKHTIRPRAVRFEQAIWRDLLSDREQGTIYAEYLLEAFLRGDSAARAAFYSAGIKGRWFTPNEIREKESMNPLEGGDEFPEQVDDSRLEGDPRDPMGRPRGTSSRAHLIALEACARVVQKEQASALKAAQKHANDPAGWQAWLGDFYRAHAEFVSHVLKVPTHQARAYAEERRAELATRGVQAIDDWDRRVVPALAALAMDSHTEEGAA